MDPLICMRLNREIHLLQRSRQFPGPAAVTVWLQSLRAMQVLRLRSHGRVLWRQLSRGFPYVENYAQNYALASGVSFEIADYDQIPDGLAQI